MSPLARLTQLKILALGRNQIRDVSPLARLTRLEALFLNGNRIRDVSPLAALVNLETLSLAGNPITDTSPLASLTKPLEVDIEIPIPTPIVHIESPDHPSMYWINTNNGTLYGLVNTEIGSLVPNVRNATSLAVDVSNEKLYWTEKIGNTTGRIRRANLDGSNVQLVKNLTSVPQGIALEATEGKLYLTNGWGKVQRLNINGSNFEPNLITELDTPGGLALDGSGGKVYWTEIPGRIRRANLNGSNVEDVATGLRDPMNIAIFGDTVYWTEKTGEDTGDIRFVNLRGTPNVRRLHAFPQGFPVGIAIDAAEKKLYWTTSRGGVGRSNLDGSSFQPNFVTGLIAPSAFALNVETPVDVETPEILTTDAIGEGNIVSPQVKDGQATEPAKLAADVNDDSVVDIQDLVLVASNFGQTGKNVADVNGDGVVNIADLAKVAEILDVPAAPALHPQALAMFTTAAVQKWLTQAQHLDLTDVTTRRGVHFLEQLLTALTPKEIALLPNYPNPFNPETWIPYQLSKPADVTITIYAVNGQVVRRLFLGHQVAGNYQTRNRAAYWDGKNGVGESVASGLYFFTLTAGDFTGTRKMLIRK